MSLSINMVTLDSEAPSATLVPFWCCMGYMWLLLQYSGTRNLCRIVHGPSAWRDQADVFSFWIIPLLLVSCRALLPSHRLPCNWPLLIFHSSFQLRRLFLKILVGKKHQSLLTCCPRHFCIYWKHSLTFSKALQEETKDSQAYLLAAYHISFEEAH